LNSFSAYLCDNKEPYSDLMCITISPFNFSVGSTGNIYNIKDLALGSDD
jgi:hypothetical protein